jgi:hypothetical protein
LFFEKGFGCGQDGDGEEKCREKGFHRTLF